MALNRKEQDDLFQLRLKAKIDSRMTACRVKVTQTPGKGILVAGYTQYPQTDAFVKATAKEIYQLPVRGKASGDGAALDFQLKILERGKPKFAVVTQAVAPIWRNPDASDPKQLDTEALYGTVLRSYHREGDFTFVQHPDGYVGYTPTAALKPVGIDDYLRWKNGEHAVTLVPLKAGELTVPPGSRLSRTDGRLVLADGSTLKVAKKDIVVFDPSRADFVTVVEKRAEVFMDSPYLWGGKTEIGIDCSGFVQTLALQEGIFLPRDASMQCHVGEIVGYLPNYDDLLPGDIMFFMNDNAFVFHVGIYLGNHTYMHSAGKTGPTKSSVFKDGKNYMSRYGSSFVYARRVHR